MYYVLLAGRLDCGVEGKQKFNVIPGRPREREIANTDEMGTPDQFQMNKCKARPWLSSSPDTKFDLVIK